MVALARFDEVILGSKLPDTSIVTVTADAVLR